MSTQSALSQIRNLTPVERGADGLGRGALRQSDAPSSFHAVAGPAGGSLFGWISLGLIILVVAGVIIFSVIRLRNQRRSAALEPLKKKFVNDEITEEEFIAKKAVLLKK